ncbi:Uncharacterised protein [uncultured archaeon]|nr:Uncharacterised protein [uncultured archaeon]
MKRITINPKVMVGKPVIRGTRLFASKTLEDASFVPLKAEAG